MNETQSRLQSLRNDCHRLRQAIEEFELRHPIIAKGDEMIQHFWEWSDRIQKAIDEVEQEVRQKEKSDERS